jgi:uncharacterized protein YciI
MVLKNDGRLFVCTLKTRCGEEAYEEIHKRAIPDHARYMSDLWRRGIFWAGGPIDDGATALEIYKADTLEEAMEAQRNAPQYLNGYLYDDQYSEWHLRHWPPARSDLDPATGKVVATNDHGDVSS